MIRFRNFILDESLILKRAHKEWQGHNDSLPPGEASSVYKKTKPDKWGAPGITHHMRAGKSEGDSDIDRVTSHRMSQKFHLYRGVQGMESEAIKKMRPGSRYSDKGYQSTSLSRSLAHSFAHKDENTPHHVVHIHAHPGTRGYFVGSLPHKELNSADKHEVLLHKNTNFRVMKHEFHPGPVKHKELRGDKKENIHRAGTHITHVETIPDSKRQHPTLRDPGPPKEHLKTMSNAQAALEKHGWKRNADLSKGHRLETWHVHPEHERHVIKVTPNKWEHGGPWVKRPGVTRGSIDDQYEKPIVAQGKTSAELQDHLKKFHK